MADMPIRILIVDDHPLLREGVAAILEDRADIVVVGEAGGGAEAVERFRTLQPDVTLMDLQMPGMNGLEAIVAIRGEFPQARILVLTTYAGDVQAVRALKAGATGYLLKSSLRTEMLDAIRNVHHGRRHVHGDVAAEIALHVTDETLSEREAAVLRLVAIGKANKEVAHALSLSEETVKAHLKNIFAKLDVTDRTHAVTVAARRGIIEL
ncbi:DNA-binding NarL/FixJ family response regulator [Sphingomonas naasensis]|uniref:Response regulator transcription factor n=1 Tax=Sphingomonas naasensis TaxID=1344951 RepID=A0A4V3QW71_9SPHN|nr:response regulator transcription factor [Sphingomonas naasensis]NIJ21655.1 DNA-binding NarL/FixJ family response regulator [Sphingomonas naasensis]TGX41412.1 response regulator transcription factor [Sphingomonas naasensis]